LHEVSTRVDKAPEGVSRYRGHVHGVEERNEEVGHDVAGLSHVYVATG
jgi:hypothetical protein